MTPPPIFLQESCARVLLFRGANKDIRNYNSQTAFQVRDCPQERGLPGARLSVSVWLGLSGPCSAPCKAVRGLWAQGRPRVRWRKGASQGSARLL